MTLDRAERVSPLVSLFGAYTPEGDRAPKPLVVELLAPAVGVGWIRSPRELPAVVRAEGLAAASPATAELFLRFRSFECRVRFADDGGAPRRIVLRGGLDTGCLRARTELSGFMDGPGGARLGSVLLRLNWRAVRLKR